MRVEVLAREEIEEKMLMTPGDIVMMLNEMGGMRVQATSPSLGAASVRIQGMRGRYTRVLSDGLPLFGESRRRSDCSRSRRWISGRWRSSRAWPRRCTGPARWAASSICCRGVRRGAEREIPAQSLDPRRDRRGRVSVGAPVATAGAHRSLGGGHWQERVTSTTMAGRTCRDTSARSCGRASSGMAAMGARSSRRRASPIEDRDGGTMRRRSAAGHRSAVRRSARDTPRTTAARSASSLVDGAIRRDRPRGASRARRHDHQFGEDLERDRHDTGFRRSRGARNGGPAHLGGRLAIERDAYTPRDVPRFDYTFTVPGVFVQDDVDVDAVALDVGERPAGRAQRIRHVLQPARFGARSRTGDWTSRLSVGTGFFGPTPLTEETEAAGLTRLAVRAAARSRARLSGSFDSVAHGRAVVLHGDVVRIADRRPDRMWTRRRRTSSAIAAGSDDQHRRRAARHISPRAVLGDRHVHLRAGARDGRRRSTEDVPLTPRHSAGHRRHVGESRTRAGRHRVVLHRPAAARGEPVPNDQRAVHDPRASRGAAVRPRSSVRQRRESQRRAPDAMGSAAATDPAADGRWTVDAWAPLEGRNAQRRRCGSSSDAGR